MALQALRADLLHHALHRRVDASDGDVRRLEVRSEHGVPRRLDRGHHPIRADRDETIHGREWNDLPAKLPDLVRKHRLDDVGAEMHVLRPAQLDRVARLRARDDLSGGTLDVYALE